MYTKMKSAVVLLVVCLTLPSCAPEPEKAIDLAEVVASHASVRQRNSATSRTLETLDPGDRVEILEHQDNWYRIRYEGRLIGWMEESTVVTNETLRRIQVMVANSQGLTPQNTGVIRDTANFRLDPGNSDPATIRAEEGREPVSPCYTRGRSLPEPHAGRPAQFFASCWR